MLHHPLNGKVDIAKVSNQGFLISKKLSFSLNLLKSKLQTISIQHPIESACLHFVQVSFCPRITC